jgi:nucleolar protein 14
VDKKYNPNKEKAELAKLKFQHKQEFKGAIRELKKDAEFIARAKMEERKTKDADYKRKIDQIMGQLASQEGAMRGYDKEKKKSKRKL